MYDGGSIPSLLFSTGQCLRAGDDANETCITSGPLLQVEVFVCVCVCVLTPPTL